MRALSLILLLPVAALGQTVSCPPALPQGSIESIRAPSGWIGFSPSQARLDGGGMMSGPPQQMGYLVPTSSRKVQGGGIATSWVFEVGEEKWLYCTYGTNAIQVAKRMDDKATECTMTSRDEWKGVIAEIKAVCK